MSQKIKITRIEKSKIQDVDFNNFSFGSVFTDHMFECDFINGKWVNPTIKPYQPISIEPSASVLHYGQAIFEGMKAYKDENDEVWLFRPDQNFERINRSAVRMAIPEFPKELFYEALTKLIDIDRDWVKYGDGRSLYIRPFVIGNEYAIQAVPSKNYKFMIICAPATLYYTKKLKVLVADKFSRAASGGVGYAKAAGNYAATFYPTKLANSKGFQQVIWLDANEHKYIEECGTMNIFFRVGDKLITPEISDSILDGITRNSVIRIARDLGIIVEERRILVSDIVDAHKEGKLKEVFGTGTAVSVSPINSLTFRSDKMTLGVVKDSYALRLKERLQSIQRGQIEDVYGWISRISVKNNII